jgi:hypothetical protein
MDQFTKSNLQTLSVEINKALAEIAHRHKIGLKLGNCSFSGQHFTAKIEGAVVDKTGEVLRKEAKDFQDYAEIWGLKPEHLGQEFSLEGKLYKIVGAKIRSSKYPILATNLETGQEYKFTAETISRVLSV